jgi:hypothetical protein
LACAFASADTDFASGSFGGKGFIDQAVAVVVFAVADLALWRSRLHGASGSCFCGVANKGSAACTFSDADIARGSFVQEGFIDFAITIVVEVIADLVGGLAGGDTLTVEADVRFTQVGVLATIVDVREDDHVHFAGGCVSLEIL